MQVSHRSGTPQEEGLSGDRVGDAQLAVLAADPRAWECCRKGAGLCDSHRP